MPILARIASLGELMATGWSSSRISPSSGCMSPYSTFISVVLPAPFSPSRARISPGWTTRSMPSLATRLPKRFVMPRNSSFTGSHPPADSGQRPRPQPGTLTSLTVTSCLVPWLHGALGGGNDLAANDVLLHRVELALKRRGDLARPVVERRQYGPAVLERADVAAALAAPCGEEDGGLHRGADALLHAGDEVLAVGRGADTAVGVHPVHGDVLARAVGGLDGLRRAEPNGARHREDDVCAVGDERVGDGLARGDVGEVARERAVLARLAPAEHLDVGAVLLVVVLHPVPEAVHVDRDRAELLTAERGHLAGLGHPGRQIAAEEGVLRSVVHQLGDVVGDRRMRLG